MNANGANTNINGNKHIVIPGNMMNNNGNINNTSNGGNNGVSN